MYLRVGGFTYPCFLMCCLSVIYLLCLSWWSRRMTGITEACPPADTGEATEKLYERHCLVIKIVSSFFCFSDKVFVSLSIDL